MKLNPITADYGRSPVSPGERRYTQMKGVTPCCFEHFSTHLLGELHTR